VKKIIIIALLVTAVLGITAYTTFFFLNNYSTSYNEFLDKKVLTKVKNLFDENRVDYFNVSKSLYPEGENAKSISISDIGILKDMEYSRSLFNDNVSKPHVYRIEVKFKDYNDRLVIATYQNSNEYYLYCNGRKFMVTSNELDKIIYN